ncbi:hypothetical protein [Fictibacillus macauensis]|nr:hypothetical protein [Fictibacillus macauensis]
MDNPFTAEDDRCIVCAGELMSFEEEQITVCDQCVERVITSFNK